MIGRKMKVERLLFRFKSKREKPIVIFLLVSVMLLIPMVVLATGGNNNEESDLTFTKDWDKQGKDSSDCPQEGEGPRAVNGWIHWEYNAKGDSTGAELVLGGSGSGTYTPGDPIEDNVWHFYTPYFDVDTLTATIYLYGGEKGAGSGLVISDYCPGFEVIPIGDLNGSINFTNVIQDADGAVVPNELTIDQEGPKSVPDSGGTVISIAYLGVLLLSSGGVLLRKYKDK